VALGGAVTAVLAGALAIGLVAAEGLAGGQEETAPARLIGTAGSGVYPSLRTVGDLGAPGDSTTDAGVGVYPALSEPQALTFPGPAAIRAARDYAATRRGRVSFAVADARGGIAGQAFDEPYRSASLIKAMILVAYLDQVERTGQGLTEADVARLQAMIRVSDNDSTSTTFRRLAPGALTRLARRAGMRSFAVDLSHWGGSQVTAADQVRFFLALDRLLPAQRRRRYARELLSHVASFHAWGIPRVARPRWRVFFKGGWRQGGSGEIVHQAALLERGPQRIAIAVLTDGNPSEVYGRATIRGIAARLLRAGDRAASAARAGTLSPIARLGGFQPPDARPLEPLSRGK
jgi:Beta-lactamase enzyme family